MLDEPLYPLLTNPGHIYEAIELLLLFSRADPFKPLKTDDHACII